MAVNATDGVSPQTLMRAHLGDVDDVASLVRAMQHVLRAAGVSQPALDARILAGHVLDMSHEQMLLYSSRAVACAHTDKATGLLNQRLAGRSVGRIIGQREFWGHRFALNPDTLEPRPDSETIIEAVLDVLGAARTDIIRIADLGAGSGCLLITLLMELPNAYGLGIDISYSAVNQARENARRHHVDARAWFACCDLAHALADGYDLIVSNPPYIPSAEIDGLPDEVRLSDPLLALDGGPQGLTAYRNMARDVVRCLKPGGMVCVEIGPQQYNAVMDLFCVAGLQPAACPLYHDLAGRRRVAVATKPG